MSRPWVVLFTASQLISQSHRPRAGTPDLLEIQNQQIVWGMDVASSGMDVASSLFLFQSMRCDSQDSAFWSPHTVSEAAAFNGRSRIEILNEVPLAKGFRGLKLQGKRFCMTFAGRESLIPIKHALTALCLRVTARRSSLLFLEFTSLVLPQGLCTCRSHSDSFPQDPTWSHLLSSSH